MSSAGRTTRSRSSKLNIAEQDGLQKRITDTFQVTRNRNRSNAKKLVEPIASSSTSITKTKISQRATAVIKEEVDISESSANQVPSPSKRPRKVEFKRIIEEKDDVAINTQIQTFSSNEVPIVEETTRTPSPRRERKVPSVTPPPQPLKPKSTTARKALFRDDAPTSVEKTTLNESPLKAMSSREDDLIGLIPTSSNVRAKIRNVAQLQAALAKKGAQKLHDQSVKTKSREVNEDALLRSPVKPQSASRRIHAHIAPKLPASSAVPDYVLPTHKTSVKKDEESDDEREQAERIRVAECRRVCSRLIPEVQASSSIPLPTNYSELATMFQNCDRIVSQCMVREKRCALPEVQRLIKMNIKRDFTAARFAQIMHLYPNSYNVKIAQQRIVDGVARGSGYEHIIEVDNTDLKDYLLPETPGNEDKEVLPGVVPQYLMSPKKSPVKKMNNVVPRVPEMEHRARLEPWRMMCRSSVFRHKLVLRVRRYHQKFMEKIGKPLTDDESDRIMDLHPMFKREIDKECGEIEEATLPMAPTSEAKRIEMKDYMECVASSTVPKSVQAAIDLLKSPQKASVASNQVPLSPKKFAESQASKPMSLLERIRAKEAAKKLALSQTDPALERRKGQIDRLLSGVLRIISTEYAKQKARSMEWSIIVDKITFSTGSKNRIEVGNLMILLCEICPEMVANVEINGKKYLQMKENDYLAMEDALKEEIQRINNTATI